MAQYNTLNVRLSNSLLKELKSEIKNVSGVTLIVIDYQSW